MQNQSNPRPLICTQLYVGSTLWTRTCGRMDYALWNTFLKEQCAIVGSWYRMLGSTAWAIIDGNCGDARRDKLCALHGILTMLRMTWQSRVSSAHTNKGPSSAAKLCASVSGWLPRETRISSVIGVSRMLTGNRISLACHPSGW